MEKKIIRRKNISEETKDKIAELYLTKEVTSKQALADMFGMTKKRCSEILTERNIKTINPWDRTKVISVIEGDKYISTEEYTFIAKHKETGIEFKDFNNVSGKLTSYQMEIHPETENLNQIAKKRYYQKTGNYWYEQFYNIIQVPIIKKKMKGELYDSDIKEMIRLYQTGEIKMIHDLGSMFKITGNRVSKILKENGVEIRKRGGQFIENKIKRVYSNKPQEKYENHDNVIYKAICKKTGLEFEDFLNNSGILTRYIMKEYPDFKIKSSKVNIRDYSISGEYWYEEFFDILPFEKPEIKKCAYCDFEMPLNVSNRQYRMHLTMQHGITIKEHLQKYPEDKNIFIENYKEIKYREDKNNLITCGISGEEYCFIGSKHLNSHGISVKDYKKQFGTNMSNSYRIAVTKRLHSYNENGLTVVKESRSELEIKDYIVSLGFSAESNRSILNGKEIDILIEDKKIGIEYNGNKWHSEWFGKKEPSHHLNKTLLANEKGYYLIHIFEDEYELNKKLISNKISHLLGVNENLPKIGARKTIIKEIGIDVTEKFLNEFHIQGVGQSTVSIGTFYNDLLIGVMTFKILNRNTNDYDLTRFATDYNYICQGVASKMLTYFIKNYNPSSIISFADRRWTLDKDNNLYTKLGFKLNDVLKPDYKYYNPTVDRYRRFHKFGFRKQTLHKKFGLPLEMTETEMVKQLGYDRIWDCGLFKYRLDLNN